MPRAKNQKPPLLFCTGRTGSWPVYHLILEGLKSRRPVQGLGEYFNLVFRSYWPVDGRIEGANFPRTVSGEDRGRMLASTGGEELAYRARERRWEMIAEAPESYFFKIFPEDVAPRLLEPLTRSYRWVLLERQDLFAQLLSNLISVNTGKWYVEGGIEVEKKSIVATTEQFHLFAQQIDQYLRYKKTLRPAATIYYEDFCKEPWARTLERVGLDPGADLSRVSLPEVQNRSSKKAAFANLREIREWYRHSFLDQLSPL